MEEPRRESPKSNFTSMIPVKNRVGRMLEGKGRHVLETQSFCQCKGSNFTKMKYILVLQT